MFPLKRVVRCNNYITSRGSLYFSIKEYDISILAQLDDTEKSNIITDEELEEIGVAYGSKEKYEKATQAITERLSSSSMGRRSTVSVGEGYSRFGRFGRRQTKIKKQSSTIPVGDVPKLKNINIVGKRIDTTDDAAALFSAFRDPRLEIFNVLYTKQGTVVAHTAWTSGLPTKTLSLDGETISEGYFKIDQLKRNLGADKIWIAHNHPSGDPRPSKHDIDITKDYFDVFGKSFAGHIILNHNKYSLINPSGLHSIWKLKKPVRNFISLKRQRAEDITSPGSIALRFKNILNNKKDVSVFAVLDGSSKIVSWVYSDHDNLLDIKNYMRASGGAKIIVLTNDNNLYKKYCTLAKNASASSLDIILDVIKTDRKTETVEENLSYFNFPGGDWQTHEKRSVKYIVNNIIDNSDSGFENKNTKENPMTKDEQALFDAAYEEQYETEPINRRSSHSYLEMRDQYNKEKFMSDEFEQEEQGKVRDLKEEAFLNALHQRKVVADALKAGTLSCLPGTDGLADTQPAVNLVNGTFYHGNNLLCLKQHTSDNQFPSSEYLTSAQIDRARQNVPDLFIKKGQKGISIYVSEKNEQSGDYENKAFRLFNVAQLNKPAAVKEWANNVQIEKLQEKEAYLQTQYGAGFKLQPKQNTPGIEISCSSAEPVKYLGEYLAAVSMGSKFKVSQEQAAEFKEKMGVALYANLTNKDGELILGKNNEPVSDPFSLSKISNKASEHCKEVIKQTHIEARKAEQPEQKQEQARSRVI